MKKITLVVAFLISFAGFSQTNKEKIQTYLDANLARLELTSKDVSDWDIQTEVYAEGTKITSTYIIQRYQGIEIFNAQSNVAIKDGRVIDLGNNFKKNIAQKVNTTTPSSTVIEAITSVYSQLGIKNQTNFAIVETINKNTFKLTDGIQEDLISAKLVYQYTADDKLKLAWTFQFYTPDGNHLWDLRINALDGQILEQNDLKVSCNFGNLKDHNHNESFSFVKSGFKNTSASILEVTPASYRVIPFNYESPNHSPFQLITAPYNTVASPYGWHDTNGVVGDEFTITRGNNSRVYEDADGNNSVGNSPNGGATLSFDFPYAGNTAQPTEYTSAASTNLFYMTNIMHDVWYQYGFNESSKNFQRKNYTGAINSPAGDAVTAESQDGYNQSEPTLNNANFFTPADGTSPRVQMYLWTLGAPPTNFITVNSPATIAGPIAATTNIFEGTDRIPVPLAPNGITADLALYNNNPTPPGYHSGCQAATNAASLTGKIVLVKRGSCFFNLKVKNAQNAGALAVIVMDSIVNNPNTQNMSSTGILGITIPAVFIKKEIGDALIAQMALGPVNVKLERPADLYLYADGDLDNGIIAHEFGHGISNRLIGGGTAGCMTNAEQMGEGWSDWFALMMQLKPGDTGADKRELGTFVINQPVDGFGIRTVPYSTDMALCPLTLNNSNDNESHNRGETWAAVLWDLTWAYIDKYGYDPDIYNGTGGNNKVMRLVLDALKLQTCNAVTFISARDKIIAADQATTGGKDYCLITEVFRRRGMGLNASSGSAASAVDQVQDFTAFPAGSNCTFLGLDYFENEDLFRVYPNPSNGQFNIRINKFIGKVTLQVVDMNGRVVYKNTDNDFNVEKTINLNYLQKGIYVLKASNESLNYTQKIILN